MCCVCRRHHRLRFEWWYLVGEADADTDAGQREERTEAAADDAEIAAVLKAPDRGWTTRELKLLVSFILVSFLRRLVGGKSW